MIKDAVFNYIASLIIFYLTLNSTIMDYIYGVKYWLSVIISKKINLMICLLFSTVFIELIELIEPFVNTQEFKKSLFTIALISVISVLFIFVDFLTGVVAARKRGEVIESKKWGKTVGKIAGLVLYVALSFFIIVILSMEKFALVILLTPLFLSILKEFISIGENFTSINGTKPYIFTMVDKLFSIVEKWFFKKVGL